MGLFDSKVFGTIPGNVYVITLGIDIGTYLSSLDGYFDGSNDVKLEKLFIGDSLGYTDGKVPGSDEGTKLGLSDGKALGNILGNVDIITLSIDVGTELGSLMGSLIIFTRFFGGQNIVDYILFLCKIPIDLCWRSLFNSW